MHDADSVSWAYQRSIGLNALAVNGPAYPMIVERSRGEEVSSLEVGLRRFLYILIPGNFRATALVVHRVITRSV